MILTLSTFFFINNSRFANVDDFIMWYYSKKLSYIEYLTSDDLFLEKVLFSLRTNWFDKNICENIDKDKLNFYIKNNYLQNKWDNVILNKKFTNLIDFIIKDLI